VIEIGIAAALSNIEALLMCLLCCSRLQGQLKEIAQRIMLLSIVLPRVTDGGTDELCFLTGSRENVPSLNF